MTLRAKLLSKFADWALSRNPAGGYAGEDDERWAYTITGEDGSPYLTRILLTRLPILDQIRKRLGVGVYVHHFHRSDGDQALHDHPWEFGASLVLNGAYVEERLDQVVTVNVDEHIEADARLARYGSTMTAADSYDYERVQPLTGSRKVITDTKLVRFWNFLTKDDFHSVRELKGDVWTLFVTGERVQDWGFLVDGQKVPWREYLSGLDVAKGDALDRIGAARNVARASRVIVNFNTDIGEPALKYEWVEPDNEYRERIRAAILAESA